MKNLIFMLLLTEVVLSLSSCTLLDDMNQENSNMTGVTYDYTGNSIENTTNTGISNSGTAVVQGISNPIDRPLERATKKVFGLKLSPESSPVSPERFSGYHAGVDFEVFPSEEEKEIKIYALCSGKILYKKWTSGYGGLIVQACILDQKEVTVLYGHLGTDSITVSVGQVVQSGALLGLLGKGYTQQTDNERKNLHLAIHKGTSLVLLGYTSTSGALNDWVDPMKYIK